jgi:hypothetical protein
MDGVYGFLFRFALLAAIFLLALLIAYLAHRRATPISTTLLTKHIALRPEIEALILASAMGRWR